MNNQPINNLPIKKEYDFEFLLKINGNIICQRSFAVNGYEPNREYDVKELMDDLTGMNNGQYGTHGIIPRFLKNRCVDYQWRSYNPYLERIENTQERPDVFENEDMIDFEINYKGQPFAASQFSGNYFQTRVRYEINIKEIIPNIFDLIRYHLS